MIGAAPPGPASAFMQSGHEFTLMLGHRQKRTNLRQNTVLTRLDLLTHCSHHAQHSRLTLVCISCAQRSECKSPGRCPKAGALAIPAWPERSELQAEKSRAIPDTDAAEHTC
jgi:hypothetical protein